MECWSDEIESFRFYKNTIEESREMDQKLVGKVDQRQNAITMVVHQLVIHQSFKAYNAVKQLVLVFFEWIIDLLSCYVQFTTLLKK